MPWSMRYCPALPPPSNTCGGPPVITFSAPGGKPAALASSPRAQQLKDAKGDGFKTTVQPAFGQLKRASKSHFHA